MRRLVILFALIFALMPAVAASDGGRLESASAAASNEIGFRVIASGDSWKPADAVPCGDAAPRSIIEGGTKKGIAVGKAAAASGNCDLRFTEEVSRRFGSDSGKPTALICDSSFGFAVDSVQTFSGDTVATAAPTGKSGCKFTAEVSRRFGSGDDKLAASTVGNGCKFTADAAVRGGGDGGKSAAPTCNSNFGFAVDGVQIFSCDTVAIAAPTGKSGCKFTLEVSRRFGSGGKSATPTCNSDFGFAADGVQTFSGDTVVTAATTGKTGCDFAADAQVFSNDSGAVIALTVGDVGRHSSDDSAQTIVSDTFARAVSGENSTLHSASDDNAPEADNESGKAVVSSDDPVLYSADDFDLGSVTDNLPSDVLENLPADIFDPSTASETGVGFFARVVSKLVRAALGPALKTFSKLLGIVVAASVIGSVRSTVKSGLSGVFDFISGLCLMLLLYGVVEGMFTLVKNYLFTLTGVMDTFIPVMSAMAAAGGDLNSAVVSSGGLILGLDLIEKLAANGLMPVLQLCFGIAMASGVGSLKLSGISKLIRDGFSWTLGLSAAAISAVMSFQTTIAARADSLSMRAVKFAASNAIPVAGGIAADAVRTVAGSLSLVKSTVGWAGVVIIALMTLPVMIQVLLTRIGVLLAGTSASVLGLEREKSLLDEVSGLLGSLIAVCLVASLMFVYALAVFAKGAVAFAG